MPNLPDDLLTEVGRVAAHAAELDMVTAALWARTTGAKPDVVDEIPWIVKVAGKHVPKLRTEIAAAADALSAVDREKVIGWLGRAAALMSERDQIVHALWLSEFEDGQLVQYGWHGRSGQSVDDDPGRWRDLSTRLGGCGAAGWELIKAIRSG